MTIATAPPATEELHLVQATMNIMELHRWAASRNILDDQIAMHCLLTESLNKESGITCFRMLTDSGTPAQLYAYCRYDAETLRETARENATDGQLRALQPDTFRSLAVKKDWQTGRELAFEARVCPAVQNTKNKGPGVPGEIDAFTRALQKAGEDCQNIFREDVYEEWMAKRIAQSGAAELKPESARLTAYTKVSTRRRNRGKPISVSDATMRGVLRITDGSRFRELLARGLGRHRAYGYGMILLK